ncbi:MAG TPA: hypothetical protein VH912_14850 [Streptosporangiaceae bacterium]|jgi:hypothetical protein
MPRPHPVSIEKVALQAVSPGDGDDDVAALLRYLGRRPDWTP